MQPKNDNTRLLQCCKRLCHGILALLVTPVLGKSDIHVENE